MTTPGDRGHMYPDREEAGPGAAEARELEAAERGAE